MNVSRPERSGALLAALALVAGVAWLPDTVALASPAPEDDAERSAPAAPPASRDDAGIALVVVADRAPADPFRAARSVTALDAAALEDAGPRTLPEALADAPGVFVQQTNPAGGTPIIRGLMGPQNLILVDGVRFNNALHRTGPTQYLNLIDPFVVRRLEVLRGPGSVLYGSDAMGGVVQILPFEAPDARGGDRAVGDGRVLLRYGSASRERTGHVGAGGGAGEWGGRIAASIRSFADLTGGRGVGLQPYTSYAQFSGFGRADWRATPDGPLDGWEASLTYLGGFQDDAERSDKLATGGSIQVYDNVDHLLYARARGPIAALRTTVALTASYHRFFERMDKVSFAEEQAPFAEERARTRDEVTADTVGLDLLLDTSLLDGRLRLRYGGTWYRDHVSAAGQERRAAGGAWQPTGLASFPDDATYDVYGGFLLLEGWPLRTAGGHAIRLAGGYRVHGMAADAAPRGGQGGAALPGADFDHLGHVFHGALQYLWRDRFTVAATFSQGFRAPNLSEAVMLGATGQWFHVPNASGLGPERSDTFELLARVRLGPVTLRAAGYASLLRDLVKRAPTTWERPDGVAVDEVDGRPVVRNVNSGDGLLVGAEGSADVALGAGFALHGAVAWTRGEEWVPDGPDLPLSRIPPLFGRVALRWDTGGPRWRGFVETLVRGALAQDRLSPQDESDVRIPPDGTPRWWAWDVRLGLAWEERWRLGLTIANLTDNRYRVHGSGVFGAGTSATLTGEARF